MTLSGGLRGFFVRGGEWHAAGEEIGDLYTEEVCGTEEVIH
ncbi:hypothetical protein ABMV15_10550 [Corynebacterium belfantii]